MSDVPSTKEELNRKTVEALAKMTLDHENGTMGTESYYQALTAINLCTSGLIDNEISDVISENLINNIHNVIERRVFLNSKTTVVLQRNMVGDSFEMIQIVDGAHKPAKKSFADADNPIKACKMAFDKFIIQLISKGFIEVGDE